MTRAQSNKRADCETEPISPASKIECGNISRQKGCDENKLGFLIGMG